MSILFGQLISKPNEVEMGKQRIRELLFGQDGKNSKRDIPLGLLNGQWKFKHLFSDLGIAKEGYLTVTGNDIETIIQGISDQLNSINPKKEG